ncbi:MAG TPA: collagen-binding domain-containing protein [Tepidisphaeraceae bacterium]
MLSYPNGDAGTYATVNDDAQAGGWINSNRDLKMGNGDWASLPGGNYYIHDMNIGSGASLWFTGPTTIYCYHNLTINGNTYTASSVPQNLKIVMCPSSGGALPGTVNVGSSADLYASIYAPQSAVTLSGSGDIYGSVLSKSIDMTGTSAIHYDTALSGSSGAVSTVR